MDNILNFFRLYGSNVIIVVVSFFTLLTAFSMLGINFNPKNKYIKQVVTIETLDNINSDNTESFCKKFSSQPHEINKYCNKLTANNCNSVSCCILTNSSKCVSGNKSGPTFHTKNGKEIEVKHYYHKNKCYGDCPIKI